MKGIVFLIVVLFGVACKSKSVQNRETHLGTGECMTINIPKAIDFNGREMLDSLQLVKLEATENSLLGHVSKLKIYKDRIYVLDRRFAKTLFIFDLNGKFIKKIQNQGRGPREFISIMNFDIAYLRDELLIMDNFGHKFGFFDLEGNYLRETYSSIEVLDAALLPDGCIVHAKSESSFWKNGRPKGHDKIYYMSGDGRILKTTFSYNDNADINYIINYVLFSSPDGRISYAPRFLDTIYDLTYDKITPRYALSFPKERRIPLEILQNSSKKEIETLVKGGKDCFLGEHLESDHYLYLETNFHRELCVAFFNKKNGKVVNIKAFEEKLKTNSFLTPLAIEGDHFWTTLNSKEVEAYREFFNARDLLLLGEDDNPYLVRYKLKNI